MDLQSNDIPIRVEQALSTLREAYEYALDTVSNSWDFAVPIRSLREIGLNESDLRWLVRKELVKHAQEVTVLGDNGREFRSTGDLTFTRRSCFVLTESGCVKASSIRTRRENGRSGNGLPVCFRSNSPIPHSPLVSQDTLTTHNSHTGSGPVVKWDADARKLQVNGLLAKRFKWPAANQEALLNAFQEEGWPNRIDDPLPPQPDQDPKRRLADTIKCLNRKQIQPLIHFHGDGTGEGVFWELVNASTPHPAAE